MFEICNLKPRFSWHVVDSEDIKTSLRDIYSEKLQKCFSQCVQRDPASRPDACALFRTASEYVRGCSKFSTAIREYRLVEAATRGDLPMIIEQMELQADIHASLSTDGETALHKAIRYGEPNIIAHILAYNAQPSQVNQEGQTAIHIAAAYAPEETRRIIFDLLLASGLDQKYDNHRRTPLHCAAAQNNYDVILAMSDFGADLEVETMDSDHSRAIHIAAENGHEKAMRTLVECGAKIQSQQANGATVLHIAAKYGHVAIISYCLALRLPIDSKFGKGKSTPLHLAAEHGHEAAGLTLVQARANRTGKTAIGQTPLHLAAAHGHDGAVFTLLTGKSRLASARKDDGDMRSLVNRKLLDIPDANGQTALHLAVKAGWRDTVTTLLDLGSNHAATNADSDTPLHLACLNGDESIVAVLLERGVRVDARGLLQNTALHYAASQGHKKVVELLLTNSFSKASVQERTSSEDTILHIAAEFDRDVLVSFLFKECDVSGDWVNRNNETALHKAAAKGHIEVIRVLLDFGVDPRKRNRFGQTPSMLAEQHNHYRCVRQLREKE
jgi:ankyrin repeat protein